MHVIKSHWVESQGGPLICASIACARDWKGVNGSSIRAQRSDYERACDCPDYLQPIKCASEEALVLGDEPLRSTLRSDSHGVLIARWIAAKSLEAAECALITVPLNLPQLESPVHFQIEDSSLVLFDAAIAQPAPVGGVHVAPGRYRVETGHHFKTDEFDFVIHRLWLDSPH